jgi:hypothetical protein
MRLWIMVNMTKGEIWVFMGESSKMVVGCFDSFDGDLKAISKYKLSGLLTRYSMNELAYDWALRNQFFQTKKSEQKTAAFIGRFTSASQAHFHFENGIQVA